jgi:hypothetical protein
MTPVSDCRCMPRRCVTKSVRHLRNVSLISNHLVMLVPLLLRSSTRSSAVTEVSRSSNSIHSAAGDEVVFSSIAAPLWPTSRPWAMALVITMGLPGDDRKSEMAQKNVIV